MRITLAQKFVILLVIVAVLPLVTFLGVSIFIFPDVTQNVINTSTTLLENDVKNSLVRLVEEKAATNNRYFEKITNTTHSFVRFAEAIWQNRSHFGEPGLYHDSNANLTALGLEGQDTFGYSIAAGVPMNETINQTLEYSSLLGRIFKPTFQADPTLEWTYLGSKYGTFMVYPYSPIPAGYDCRNRPWYQNAINSTLNPSRGVILTDPYVDAGGAGLVISAAMPAYNGTSDFIGVLGLDVTINYINETVLAPLPYNNSYSFVINNRGLIVARPDYDPGDLGWDQSFEVEDLTQSTDAQFRDLAQKMINGETGIIKITANNTERFVAYAPIKSVEWSFASVVDVSEAMGVIGGANQLLLQNTRTRQFFLSMLLIGSILGTFVVGLGVSRLISHPIVRLSDIAQMTSRGQLDTEIPFTNRNDEIGDLANSFKRMTASLKFIGEEDKD